MLKILLGLFSLVGFFFLGNAERHEMKLSPAVYWITWVAGGISGSVYVGTQIGGSAGLIVGLVLAGLYSVAVSWSMRKSVANVTTKEQTNDIEEEELEKPSSRLQ